MWVFRVRQLKLRMYFRKWTKKLGIGDTRRKTLSSSCIPNLSPVSPDWTLFWGKGKVGVEISRSPNCHCSQGGSTSKKGSWISRWIDPWFPLLLSSWRAGNTQGCSSSENQSRHTKRHCQHDSSHSKKPPNSIPQKRRRSYSLALLLRLRERPHHLKDLHSKEELNSIQHLVTDVNQYHRDRPPRFNAGNWIMMPLVRVVVERVREKGGGVGTSLQKCLEFHKRSLVLFGLLIVSLRFILGKSDFSREGKPRRLC